MSASWIISPVILVRVARLPSDALETMRLDRSAQAAEYLDKADQDREQLVAPLIDQLYANIEGCEDTAVRRLFLKIKRRLYNRQHISASLAELESVSLPPALHGALETLKQADAHHAVTTAHYEQTFAREWNANKSSLRDLSSDPAFRSGILLSSRDLLKAIGDIARVGVHEELSVKLNNQECAIAKYAVRAITRTTPFGGFVGVALVATREEHPLRNVQAAVMRPDARHPRWLSYLQLNCGIVSQWLRRRLCASEVEHLPLRITPLFTRSNTSASSVTALRTSHGVTASSSFEETWISALLTPTVEELLINVDGRSAHQLADALAGPECSSDEWLLLIRHMMDTGLLEACLPPVDDPTPTGIRDLSHALNGLGIHSTSPVLTQVADALEKCSHSPLPERVTLVDAIADMLDSPVTPVYEDLVLDGLTLADIGIDVCALRRSLLPALEFARDAVTPRYHQLLCQAFLARFGPTGTCSDVPGFIIELLRDGAFMTRFRSPAEPPTWLRSPLIKAILSASGSVLSLDQRLLSSERVRRPYSSCSFAAFVQVETLDDGPTGKEDYRVVLNGFQSGRAKYFSRYLAYDSPSARDALTLIRGQFISPDTGAVPVEIKPTLGSNFQLHPTLTEWALEIPGETQSRSAGVLPLSDLSITYNAVNQVLEIHSQTLQRLIEPVHCGFLRDEYLPEALLILRAFSMHMCEDAVAERADIYNLLDLYELEHCGSLHYHRPRLQVANLVIERQRWAFPIAEVPMKHKSESLSAFFRRILRWRASHDLPQCTFARVIGAEDIVAVTVPRLYLDWHNSYSLMGLRRFVDSGDQKLNANAWLVLTEALPAPERAIININGRRHVSEVVVEFTSGVDNV
jgi:hypothetical protein